MKIFRFLHSRVRALFGKTKLDAEMAEEMRAHLELQTERNVAAGMSPIEARYAAQRQFGGVDQIKERAREQRAGKRLGDVGRNFRFALRHLGKSPGFVVVAVLTLALGIGLNTAMFSVLNGFLLRPLSYPESGRLFRLDHVTPQQTSSSHAYANFSDIAREGADVAELAAYRFWAFTLTEPNQPADVPIAIGVSANFFQVLGQQPFAGRVFLPEEDVPGKNNVIVISHRYWQGHFGGKPDVVGRSVRLDGQPVEIVGILPLDDDAVRILAPIGIYRPMALLDAQKADRTNGSVSVIGRFHSGISGEQGSARFTAIGRQLSAAHPAENAGTGLIVRPLQSLTLTGVGRTMTFLLVGLAGFVLLIACANLANLLLARAMARRREFSVRAALGASRSQLIAPVVTECLLLTATGAGAAALVSWWATGWLAQRFGDPANPVDFSTDARVWSFTLGISAVTALLFGIAPAWLISRVDSNEALKNGAHGSGGSPRENRFRQLLTVTQFALALVLLAGANFFVRGVEKLMRVESGWRPDALICGTLNLASAKYSAAEPIIAFHAQLREKLLALPGVANSAVSFEQPLFSSPAERRYFVEGHASPPVGAEALASTNAVSASYFDTVGTRLVRGRLIDERDQLKSQPVVVINDAMARALFPGEDPLGRRLGLIGQADPSWAEIVGVAEDVKSPGVRPSAIRFQVYKPYAQEPWQYVTLSVRASDPAKVNGLLEPIRRAVASLDADQPVVNLMPTVQRMETQSRVWQTISQLLTLFAGLGLLLAALGVYGVITRLVTQRTGEIGIRVALGAQMRDIMRLVLGGGIRMACGGIAAGLLGAALLGRFLTAELPVFGGSETRPLFSAAATIFAVALAAAFFPARRAAKVDPMVALRCE